LNTPSESFNPGQPPVVAVIEVQEFGQGGRVDLHQWGGRGGAKFRLSIDQGTLNIMNQNH
jgi:hypothetical protein